MRSRPDAVLSPSTKAARERQNCPPSPQVRATALPTRWPDANFDFTAFDTVRVRDGALGDNCAEARKEVEYGIYGAQDY